MNPDHRRKSTRVFGVTLIAGALVAAFAVPAFAAVGASGTSATSGTDAAHGAVQPGGKTAYQDAGGSAQQLVVASDAKAGAVSRGSYAATTPEEIDTKKAEEAAVARAKAAAEAEAKAAADAAAAAQASTSEAPSSGYSNDGLVMVNPGGAIRLPLPAGSYSLGDVFMDPSRSNHEGQDMLAPAMTPIYSTADGVVVVSQESYYGFGNAIVIQHDMGGTQVKSYYAHMTYGTRRVQVGDTVTAGQLIGQVGSTGNSTANHLHFEIEVNGSLVDPMAWLSANGVNP